MIFLFHFGSLGVPSFVCPLVDALKVTYRISVAESLQITIVDKTVFGRNSTQVGMHSDALVPSHSALRNRRQVILGGEEVMRATRGGRKRFMLSVSKRTSLLLVGALTSSLPALYIARVIWTRPQLDRRFGPWR